MARRGRPPIYSDALAESIITRLSEGEPLAKICKRPDMPDYTTVKKWQDENADFARRSARAREDGTHYMADDCLRIADDKKIDPADKRIMIDTRLRLIGKWNSRAYGDKAELDVNHHGAIQMNITDADTKTQ